MEPDIIKTIIGQSQELNKIFKNCPVEILEQWEVKEYPVGTIIYNQGEKCDRLSIIIEGCVDIYALAENGRRYSPRILEKGDFIGEMELFEEKPLLNSVESITKLKVLQIKREYFMKWLELDSNISMYILRYSNNRFCFCAQKAMENSVYPLKTRVCDYLLSCCKQMGNGAGNVEIKVNKEKLSDRFAVTVRSINRILHSLKKNNLIDVNTDSITIKDSRKLSIEVEKSRSQ